MPTSRKQPNPTRLKLARPKHEDRFWSKVDQPLEGCWLWQAGCFDTGYGAFYLDGQNRGAHGVAWELANGPLPEGMWVLHHCDVPQCVRPDHLYAGTITDNARDMVMRGQQVRGGVVYGAKLTEDEALLIRRMRQEGALLTELAAEFGVSITTISRIGLGKTWTHV